MLQVYDRVLTSHSVSTLVALSILTAGLFLFLGVLDVLRGQTLVRLGKKSMPIWHRWPFVLPFAPLSLGPPQPKPRNRCAMSTR